MSFEDFKSEVVRIVGKSNVQLRPEELYPFKFDASFIVGRIPKLAVYPRTTMHISRILSLANEYKVPVIPRGRGSSLSGGPLPLQENSIVMSLAMMDNIIKVNLEDSYVIVEPGVVIDELNADLASYGYMFPPDPASSSAATIGGAISTNAGGIRGAKYGTVKNWVLEVEAVLPTGDIVILGNKTLKWRQGPDLLGLIIGSEGTLAVVSQATLKIWPLPEKVVRVLVYFNDVNSAARLTAEFAKARVKPLAMEFLDRLTMDAVSKSTGLKFPKEAEFLILIDIDGPPEAIKRYLNRVLEIINELKPVEVASSDDPEEMSRLYAARKGAYSSLLKLRRRPSETVYMEDIVVPATKLPEMLNEIYSLSRKYDLLTPTFGHIGDGNLHPNVIFDMTDKEEVKRVEMLLRETSLIAVKMGGYISGEHGIGIVRRDIFKEALKLRKSEKILEILRGVKRVFDPNNILNPGKII